MKAKASHAAVADKIARKESAVERFERGQTWPAHEIERYAAGYAAVSGVADPRQIIQDSINTWFKMGQKPLTAAERVALDAEEDETAEAAILRLLEEISHAGGISAAPDEDAQRPTSTSKRLAAER